MAQRSSLLGVVGRIVFAIPFCVRGVVAVFGGHGALGSIAFGVVFFGLGVIQIAAALRSRISREARAKLTPLGPLVLPEPSRELAYRAPAGATHATAAAVYALALPTLPVQRMTTVRGRVLPVTLTRRPQNPMLGMGFSVVWLAIVTPNAVAMYRSGSIIPAAFLTLFIGAGVLLFVSSLKRILARQKLARVEIGGEPVFSGDEIEIYVEQPGPARVTRITAHVRCEERATYTVGTTTTTETKEVYRSELFDALATGAPWSTRVRTTLPAAPHSFLASKNEIVWLVGVKAEIEAWPDYDEAFVFRVLPKVSP